MQRVGNCNHCGECCGGLKPDGTRIQPWRIGSPPHTIATWSIESQENHPLYKLVSHPSLTGFRKGTVNIDGTDFDYEWVPEIGLVKSKDEPYCPFYLPDAEEGKCGIYGTSAHGIWEEVCSTYPGVKLDTQGVIIHFNEFPSCSYEYVEE